MGPTEETESDDCDGDDDDDDDDDAAAAGDVWATMVVELRLELVVVKSLDVEEVLEVVVLELEVVVVRDVVLGLELELLVRAGGKSCSVPTAVVVSQS